MKNPYESQRSEVKKMAEVRSRQLLEYGVPGMKWGVTNPKTRLSAVKGKELPVIAGVQPYPAGSSGKEKQALDKARRLSRISLDAGDRSVYAKTTLGAKRLRAVAASAEIASRRLKAAVARDGHTIMARKGRSVFPMRLPESPWYRQDTSRGVEVPRGSRTYVGPHKVRKGY
jgi:hypothetical protein